MKEIAKWISVLHRQFNNYIMDHLKDHEINSSQYVFLTMLYKEDGITQEELSSRLYMCKSATTKALKKLEQMNYIKRLRSTTDKRAYNVYLTEKARKEEQLMMSLLDSWVDVITCDLTEKELQVLLPLLEKMGHHALSATYEKYKQLK